MLIGSVPRLLFGALISMVCVLVRRWIAGSSFTWFFMRSLRFLWYRFPVSVEFLLGLWAALAACSCSLVVQYISGILVMNVGSCGSMDDAWFVRRCTPWSYSSPLQCCWPPLSCGVRGSSVEPSVITCRTNMVLIRLISDSRDSEFALVWPPPLIIVGAERIICGRSWKLRSFMC